MANIKTTVEEQEENAPGVVITKPWPDKSNIPGLQENLLHALEWYTQKQAQKRAQEETEADPG